MIGARIVSDSWSAYYSLSLCGYRHLMVNHKIAFRDKTSGANSNRVEGIWTHAKKDLKLTKKMSSLEIEDHLNVFRWRYKWKYNEKKRFEIFLLAISLYASDVCV